MQRPNNLSETKFNLSTVLEHHARNSSNKESLIFADKRITFAQLDAAAISMMAVTGVPSDEYGEEIKACVVLKPDAQLSEQELVAWIKERITSYKYPRVIEFLSSLPMGDSGKILKRELRGK